MSQVISGGGVYTGQNDANGNPVVMGFVGSGAPPTWTGPVPNKTPANLSYVQGVAQYPPPGQEFAAVRRYDELWIWEYVLQREWNYARDYKIRSGQWSMDRRLEIPPQFSSTRRNPGS